MTKQSNKNKFLATAVTATMVATAFAPVASVAAAETTFPDVDPNVVGQSSADAVAALAEAGIIKGIDGQFKPGASISRAEASQMVAKLFDLKTGEVKNETTFEDVKDNAWYTGAINSLVEKDILKGKSEKSFEPGSDIKRSELALVLVKAYGLQDVNVDDVKLPYTDVKAGSWYEKSVKILYKEGLLKGTTATTFSPDSPMKRVDFARLAVETDYAHGTKLPKPEETVELAVESVSAIETTFVEVEFAALKEEIKGATVEVKDSEGKVVATKSTDIAKGATSAQFDFEKAVNANDLKGVWTVDGVEYSFDELNLVKDINTNATAGNQLALLNNLKEAGITGVDEKLIAQYATALDAANPQAVTFADVQKIVDKVNKDAGKAADEAEVIKAVQKAETQVALYNVLKNNFERVNSDWAKEYASGDTNVAGIKLTAPGSDNTIYTDASDTTGTTAEAVQKAIDAVNAKEIEKAETAATTAAKQAEVTALIQKWTKDDVAPAKDKAEAVKDSQVKEAVLRVKEATTQNSVYNSLVNLSNLDKTTGKLNAKLTSFYFEAQKVSALDKTVAKVNNEIITKADSEALKAALGDVVAAFGAINTAETATPGSSTAVQKTALKTALQKVADYTSHLTGTAKFDMSIVKDENLVAYAKVFADSTAITNTSTVVNVVDKITPVNAAKSLDSALEAINHKDATATTVRAALTDIAVADTTNGTDFIDLSPQAKLEVAEMVLKNRKTQQDEKYANLDAILDNSGEGALADAIEAHADKVDKFNAIGDLASSSTSATKGHLDEFAYDAYVALTAAQKIAVAEEINKLVHVDKDGKATPYNFTKGSGKDEVKTLKAANDIIDAAIAKVK